MSHAPLVSRDDGVVADDFVEEEGDGETPYYQQHCEQQGRSLLRMMPI